MNEEAGNRFGSSFYYFSTHTHRLNGRNDMGLSDSFRSITRTDNLQTITAIHHLIWACRTNYTHTHTHSTRLSRHSSSRNVIVDDCQLFTEIVHKWCWWRETEVNCPIKNICTMFVCGSRFFLSHLLTDWVSERKETWVSRSLPPSFCVSVSAWDETKNCEVNKNTTYKWLNEKNALKTGISYRCETVEKNRLMQAAIKIAKWWNNNNRERKQQKQHWHSIAFVMLSIQFVSNWCRMCVSVDYYSLSVKELSWLRWSSRAKPFGKTPSPPKERIFRLWNTFLFP